LKDRGDSVVEIDILTGDDIRLLKTGLLLAGCEEVYHQAAISSVGECEENPFLAHETNVSGFLNILLAAKHAGVRRFVYASSAAVHGDSVYGATKRADEAYALLFPGSVGLRYFNVYGDGSRGVIAQWTERMLQGKPVEIHGDGEQTRDFIHVSDVVHANLRKPAGIHEIGSGRAISMNALFRNLADQHAYRKAPIYTPARPGDIRHSEAS
jgi:nucleoside-diphosphate-sugar epimerase